MFAFLLTIIVTTCALCGLAEPVSQLELNDVVLSELPSELAQLFTGGFTVDYGMTVGEIARGLSKSVGYRVGDSSVVLIDYDGNILGELEAEFDEDDDIYSFASVEDAIAVAVADDSDRPDADEIESWASEHVMLVLEGLALEDDALADLKAGNLSCLNSSNSNIFIVQDSSNSG